MNRNFWGGSARLRPLLWRVGLFLLLVSVVSAQTIWTERHRRAGGALWGIAEGNAGIVAVGEAGRVLFSLDGTAWSSVPSGTSAWLVAVCGGAGEFVAVGDFGTILRSANGLDWTLAKSVPTRARLNNVAYEDGQYVVVGEGGVILYSNDGDTWFETSSGVTGWLRGLTRVNGMWVAGGQKGPLVVSFDGKVWTKKPGLDFDIEGLVPGLDLLGDPSAPVRYIRYVGESGQVGQVLLTIGGGMIYYRLAPWYICSHTVTPSRLLTLVNLNQKVVVAGENGEVYLTKLPLNNGVFARAILPTAATFLGSGIARNCVWLVGSDETILQSEPAAPTRLVNLSTRGVVGKRGQPMIAGTVVTGDTMREFLVRGVGPGLRPFVGDAALERADLSVYRADGSLSFFCRGGDKLPIEEATRISSNVGVFPFRRGV